MKLTDMVVRTIKPYRGIDEAGPNPFNPDSRVYPAGADGDEGPEFDKMRVKRFFTKLESSPLRKMMNFKTPAEQAEAIEKFAEMVGVPKAKLAGVIRQLRDLSS